MTAREVTKVSIEAFMDMTQRIENEGKRFELVNGEVVEDMAGGTGGEHGEVAARIIFYLMQHILPNDLGRVTASETCYQLELDENGNALVRCPDIGFIRRERALMPLASSYIPFAPDLAVEVISPGNRAGEMHERIRDFLRFGTAVVWEVHPTTQTVIVHTAEGARPVERDGILDGGTVLPDFNLLVAQCFPRPLVSDPSGS